MQSTEIEAELMRKMEQAASRLSFLSNVSRILSGALTDDDCFDRLLQLVVPQLADWAGINILTEQDRIVRINVAHADHQKEEELRRLARLFQPQVDDSIGPGRAIGSGQAELFPRLSHGQLANLLHDEDKARKLEQLGIASAISVPLRAHGKILGALWMATSDSGRTFTEEDFKLAEEVAERAAYSVYHLIRYRRTTESLEKLRIEKRMREKHFANTRHDVLTALTAALLSVELLDRRAGGSDELTRRISRALHQIAEMIRFSGPVVPLKESA